MAPDLKSKLLNLPAEVRNSSSFLVWRRGAVPNKKGKLPKEPHDLRDLAAGMKDRRECARYTLNEVVACVESGKADGVGYFPQGDVILVDFDECVQSGEITNGEVREAVEKLNSYTEISPSGQGLRVIVRGQAPRAPKDEKKNPLGTNLLARKTDLVEIYPNSPSSNYCSVTGDRLTEFPGEARQLDADEVAWLYSLAGDQKEEAAELKVKLRARTRALLRGETDKAGDSEAVGQLVTHLLCDTLFDATEVDRLFKTSKYYTDPSCKWCPKHEGKWERRREEEIAKATPIARALLQNLWRSRHEPAELIDPSSWREGCKTLGQLNPNPPSFLIAAPAGLPKTAGLVPKKALTLNVAPSYNGKTWFSLQEANAIATGQPLWCFPGPGEPLPVIYHVPEMNESLVRYYAEQIGIQESENFLFRAMESGLWPLNDPRMLRSAEGRVVFLDTAGYFNPADDTNAYNQALRFADLVYQVLNAGALAVVGLYHISKAAADSKDAWTLENSVIGSVGYGGILRSCVRLQNLKEDKNDEDPWVYVQGLKNPGLKPFQLQGTPLGMRVPPSASSPYLRDLLGPDAQETLARQCIREGLGVNETERRLQAQFKKKAWSHGTVVARHAKFKAEESGEQDEPTF